MIDPDKPVRLTQAPEYTGRVTRLMKGGTVASVEFEGGGSGLFRLDALEQVEDKVWPPPDLERKTPTVEVK